jgi:hypothetical protein
VEGLFYSDTRKEGRGGEIGARKKKKKEKRSYKA